jgi:hypothetical protein
VTIDGQLARADQVKQMEGGFIAIDLKQGQTALLISVALDLVDLSIEPIQVPEADLNIFGLNAKSEARIPGHNFYYVQKGGGKASVVPTAVQKKTVQQAVHPLSAKGSAQ